MKENIVCKSSRYNRKTEKKKRQSFMEELEKTINKSEEVLQDVFEKQREAREYRKALSKAAKKRR